MIDDTLLQTNGDSNTIEKAKISEFYNVKQEKGMWQYYD